MQMDQYDPIVTGAGYGGAALAQRPAPCCHRILLIERGDSLPRSHEKWDVKTVAAYRANETWCDKHSKPFFIISWAVTRRCTVRHCSARVRAVRLRSPRSRCA